MRRPTVKMQFDDLNQPIRTGGNGYGRPPSLHKQVLKLVALVPPENVATKCNDTEETQRKDPVWPPGGLFARTRSKNVITHGIRFLAVAENAELIDPDEVTNLGQPAAFQIVEPRPTGRIQQLRDHPKYVAVSYCWPRARGEELNQERAAQMKYPIQDQRGGTRETVAHPQVIERAFAYASEKDSGRIKYVWIDQECINQNDRADVEHGLKSMTSIYENATYVVALLQATLESRHEVDALRHLSTEHLEMGEEYLKTATEILLRISQDPWFRRCWTFQEATSGGKSIDLSIRCNPSWKGQEDNDEWGAVRNEIQFDWGHITAWIAKLQNEVDHFNGCLGFDIPSLQETITAIKKSHMCRFPQNLKQKRPRRNYNAAMALKLLAERQNSREPDRVAIMANLGDYLIRLHTKKIAKGFNMVDCILVQALLNGDLSLLAGIARKAWHIAQRPKTDFTWLPPDNTVVTSNELHAYDEGHQPLRAADLTLTKAGMLIQGYLWVIHGPPFDVQSVKAKYILDWKSLPDEKQQRSVYTLWDDLVEPKVLEDEGNEIDPADKPRFSTHSTSLTHPDSAHTSRQQLLASRILWDLLRLLVQKEKVDVANVIWHSYRRKRPAQTQAEMQERLIKRKNNLTAPRRVTKEGQQAQGAWLEQHHPGGQLPTQLPDTLNKWIVPIADDRLDLMIPCLHDESRLTRLFVPVEHNWHWLITRVMDNGQLMLGRAGDYEKPWEWNAREMGSHGQFKSSRVMEGLSALKSPTQKRPPCVFDVDSECDIFTPDCKGMEDNNDLNRIQINSLPPLRSKRISWIVKPWTVKPPATLHKRKRSVENGTCGPTDSNSRSRWQQGSTSGVNRIYLTNGMVAGAWRLGSIVPQQVTLK